MTRLFFFPSLENIFISESIFSRANSPDFNAAFRYTTPSANGTTLSVGLYDPSNIKSATTDGAATAITAEGANMPRLEAELNINLSAISEGSNIVVSGMYQEAEVQSTQSTAGSGGGPEVNAEGIHVGGTLVGGPVSFTAHYYNGECLGVTLQMSHGALSGDGQCREHDGYYVQATYNYGGGKAGISWGGSYQDKAGNDGQTNDPKSEQEMFTAGIYHNLAPEWLAVVEYSHAEESWHDMDDGDEDGESDIFSVGMFYLW